MIIKNPYRITEYCGERELIPTTTNGVLLGKDWCKLVADRLIVSGIPATVKKSATYGYYVVRSSTLGEKIKDNNEGNT